MAFRHKVESGLPSNVPFYGDTTNRDHYGPKLPLAPKKIEYLEKISFLMY